MSEHEMADNDQSVESLLGRLEESFSEVRQALLETNQKTAFYEGFDQSIRAAVTDALELAKGIRTRAAKDAEAAQESLERETIQVLSELTAVRERCQEIFQELRQSRELQRQGLQRERERVQQELAELRAEAEREIARMHEKAIEERNRLLEEIATLKQERDFIREKWETRLVEHPRSVEGPPLPADYHLPGKEVADQDSTASLAEQPLDEPIASLEQPMAGSVDSLEEQPAMEAAASTEVMPLAGSVASIEEHPATEVESVASIEEQPKEQPAEPPAHPEMNEELSRTNAWGRVPTNGATSSSAPPVPASQRRHRRGIWDIIFGRY